MSFIEVRDLVIEFTRVDENGIEIPYNYVNVVMSGEKG